MLKAYQVNDTIENLHFTGIKDDCIVCDTHLVWILEVSWANLYEKKEAEAISYMNWLASVINENGVPVQHISQSRPKDFSHHIRYVESKLKENDYMLKFKKDLEWFELYYENDLKEGKITKEEIKTQFENAPEYIERSMYNSYLERLNVMVKNNNILEKKYYFVISTLDQPNGIEELDIEKSYSTVMNFSNQECYESYKEKLEKKIKHTISIISENSWMAVRKQNTSNLKNIMFDYFNFPLSQKHKINENITEYGKVPPILENSYVNKDETKAEQNFLLKQWERWINFVSSFIAKEESGGLNKKSNNILQLIKPFSINDSEMEYLKINDSYSFTIHINRFWDEYLEDLALWPILTLPYLYDLSVHHIPLNREAFLLGIKKKKQRIESDFEERRKGKSTSVVGLEKDKAQFELDKISRLEADMRNKTSWYYSTSIDVTFRASTEEELYSMKEKVKEKLSTKRIFFSEATGNHLDWFITTAPLLQNKIAGHGKIFDRYEQSLEELTHYYPYCPDSINSEKWIAIGVSKQGSGDDEVKNITFYDYFDRTRVLNSIGLWIWQSGSWKTTFEHQKAKVQELLWNRHLFIDFLWNYVQWAEDMPNKYRVIKIDPLSSNKINPCDIIFPNNEQLSENENFKGLEIDKIKEIIIDDKISELSAYFKMFLEDRYWPIERWVLDKATKNTYQEKLKDFDITKNKFFWEVMLTDIIETLGKEKDKDKKIISKDIISILDSYATWSFSWMFNSRTNIELDNKSFVFFLGWNKTDKYKELAILQAFIIVKRIVYSSSKNILVIDELHELLRIKSNEIQNFFRSQMATIRNLDWGIFAWTQFLDQILSTQAWKEFFKLATTKIYLAWWLSNSDDELNVLNYEKSLSNSSKNYLLNHNKPGYWILLVWWEQIQLKIDNHPDMSMFERYKPLKKKY